MPRFPDCMIPRRAEKGMNVLLTSICSAMLLHMDKIGAGELLSSIHMFPVGLKDHRNAHQML